MKKFLAIILAVVLCVSLLAACPTNETDKESSEVAPNPVEIRSVGMFGGTDPSAGAYEDIIKDFQDEYDYITVKDESATADDAWKAQVLGDVNSGNEPDVLFFYTDAQAKDIQNKFVDIETIREEYPDYASNISDAAWSFLKQEDGKINAVPIRGYWEGVFTNQKLFTENSLDLPTDWSKLEAAIEGFAKTDVTPVAVALGHIPHYWIEHLILAYGGVDAMAVSQTIGVDTAKIPESWVNAFTAFKTLADMKAFPKNTASTDNDAVGLLFQEGKAAMQIDGSWYAGAVEALGEDCTVLPMPAAAGSPKDPSDIVAGYSSGFYISKKAWDDEDKRDACVKFVNAVTSTEAIKAYCEVGGAPADADAEPTSLKGAAAAGAKMAAAAKSAHSPTDAYLAAACCEALRAGANDIAAGKVKDVKAMIEEAIAKNV